MFGNTMTTTTTTTHDSDKTNQQNNNSYTPVKINHEGNSTEAGANFSRRQMGPNYQNFPGGDTYGSSANNSNNNSDLKQGVKSLQMNVSSVPFNGCNLYGSGKKTQGMEETNSNNFSKTNPYFLNNYPTGGAPQYTGFDKGYIPATLLNKNLGKKLNKLQIN